MKHIDLTDAHISTLRELWCRPHMFAKTDMQIEEDLICAGLMNAGIGGDTRPLSWAGSKKCHDLIKSGDFDRIAT